MNAKIVTTEVVDFSMRNGQLILTLTLERDGYSYGSTIQVLQRKLEFRDGGGSVVLLDCLADVLAIAKKHAIDIDKEIAVRPIDFARFVSYLMSLGSVITQSWRFSQVELEYGIDLHANSPRVDEGSLRFLTLNSDLNIGPLTIKDCILKLSNMKFSCKDYPVGCKK